MEFIQAPQTPPILSAVFEQVGPILALAFVAVVLLATAKLSYRQKRRVSGRFRQKSNVVPLQAAPATTATQPKTNDAAQASLAALSQCDLDTRAIMSKAQAQLGKQLTTYCRDRGLRIHAETAMSAILSVKHPDRNMRHQGFNAISRKRVDFCLTDSADKPVCIVEYQGGGHWTSGGAATERRDKTKRAAFAMARLPLLEVPARWNWAEVSNQLDALLSQTAAADTFKGRIDRPES